MSIKNISYFIKRMDSLPTLPNVVTKLLQVIDDSRSAARDLENVISKDEALTVKILKIVNSAFYGLSGKIYSVNHGVVMLGYHNIKNLALGISIFKSIGQQNSDAPFNIGRFWEHSLACGNSSKLIAVKTGYPNPEEAFVAGLLHDIGKMVMNQYSPEEYAKTINLAKEEGITISDAEEKVMETTHAVIGEWAAKEWKLPLSLTKAIRYHHNPSLPDSIFSDTEKKLVILVYISDILCKQLGYGLLEEEPVPEIDNDILNHIILKEENMEEILNGIEKEINLSKKFFEI